MNKKIHKDRWNALTELIDSGEYAEQCELLSALKKKGVETTQATLSRDLARLGIVKEGGCYRRAQGPASNRSNITSFTYAEPNLVVVKTAPSIASATCLIIDSAHIDGVIGTVAGDDTIICVINPPKVYKSVIEALKKLLNVKQ